MLNTKISLEQACSIIKKGGVAAIPTETVYGLAGDIYSSTAIKQIFQIKKRPFFDPLIVHFAFKKQLKELCQYDTPIVEKLSDYFHPGPLTLVLRKKPSVSSLITAGSNTIAVRMPGHPLALELIKRTGSCLAAPSANLFSKASPTRAEHILQSLKIPVLDGGVCQVGIESTILKIHPSQKTLSILRPGVIGPSDIESFLKNQKLNWKVQYQNSSAPGQFQNHYQPDVPFIIIQSSRENPAPAAVEEKIKQYYPDRKPIEINLKNNAAIFARELYHNLRQLPEKSIGYVINNTSRRPNEDWIPIWDRLKKASTAEVYI